MLYEYENIGIQNIGIHFIVKVYFGIMRCYFYSILIVSLSAYEIYNSKHINVSTINYYIMKVKSRKNAHGKKPREKMN